jgi:CubicO group peptidase (beta-lactamase class C family)
MTRVTHLKIIFTCLLCMLVTACGMLPQHGRRDTDENIQRNLSTDNLQATVDSLALPLIESGETPGMIVGVLLPDRSMQYFGYGVMDYDTKKKPDENTLFAVGSISKGFLGDLTALLVNEGILSWSDTLGDLLPSSDAHLSADAKKITVLQLATHTSGLPLQPFTFQTFRYLMQYLFTGENFYRHIDTPHVLDYLSDFKAPAKVTGEYSNIGYGILGYVVEQRTGQPLDELLKKKLLQPLGMNNTGYLPDSLPAYANRAYGHVGDQPKFKRRGERMEDWHFTDLMKGSAGIYSNARDLLILASAHLHDEDSRINSTLAGTLKVYFPGPVDAHAIAWYVNDNDNDNQHIVYQVGLVSGFSSYLGLDLKRKTAVIVLQNSFNWTDHVGHNLLMLMKQNNLQ